MNINPKYKDYSEADRTKAFQLWVRYRSAPRVAKELGIPKSTISNWMVKYKWSQSAPDALNINMTKGLKNLSVDSMLSMFLNDSPVLSMLQSKATDFIMNENFKFTRFSEVRSTLRLLMEYKMGLMKLILEARKLEQEANKDEKTRRDTTAKVLTQQMEQALGPVDQMTERLESILKEEEPEVPEPLNHDE